MAREEGTERRDSGKWLISEIRKSINYARIEFNYTYGDIVAILDMMKFDINCEAAGLHDDEDEDEDEDEFGLFSNNNDDED